MAAFLRTALLVALLLSLGAHAFRSSDLEEEEVDKKPSESYTTSFSELSQPSAGVKRALFVAFTYSGDSKLSGPCYDLLNMIEFAVRQKYDEIVYITDGCQNKLPSQAVRMYKSKAQITKSYLKNAFKWLTDVPEGSALLLYYSGHGETVKYKGPEKAKGEDECNGQDEALSLPDGKEYVDDDLFQDLVLQVPPSVHLFAIVDACFSGTMLDLPWVWRHQKYYYSCPDDAASRVYSSDQFEWEWAKKPEELDRPYHVAGTVTFISASQPTRTSDDAILTKFNGKTIGGMLTFRLTLPHWDYSDGLMLNTKGPLKPPILDTAIAEQWTYAQLVQELVSQVSNGDLTSLSTQKHQIPQFCTSDKVNMDAVFTLDGSTLTRKWAEAKDKCPTGAWFKKKDKLKQC